MTPSSLVVASRFNGPPGSANGGYLAGLLAAHLASAPEGPVTVTLREPPPLEVALSIQADDGGRLAATVGGAVVATAEPGAFSSDPVDPVAGDVAREAERRYGGLRSHPFPGCYVCGPQRPAGDGMGLRPGRVAPSGDAGPVACTWVPDGSQASDGAIVDPALVWAALDCPSGWASDLEARPMVLGRITARVDARPRVGDECVVVAQVLGGEGRKAYTASTAYDPDGRVLGRAECTWIALIR